MGEIWTQFAMLVPYMFALVVFRRYVESRERRRDDERRAQREALEREWRVGIPYDPDPNERS